MVQQHRVGRAQLEHTGLGLDRHHARTEHVAHRGDRPVGDRAGAAEAAAEQAAERGAAEGRGQPAQLPAVRPRLPIEIGQADAGLGTAGAVANPAEAVVAAHVEHDAAVQRRRLAVVAGAAAAQRDRDRVAGAGGDDAADLVFGAGPHGELSALVGQLALEHRAEPGEVLRQPGDALRVGDPVEVGELVGQARGERGIVCHRMSGEGDQSRVISLACHEPRAARVSQAIDANRATPVSEMSSSAANMRGMLSWKPDCMIW